MMTPEDIIQRRLMVSPTSSGNAVGITEYILKDLEKAGYSIVPKEASLGLLQSMALRWDHGIFAPLFGREETATERQQRINAVLTSMRQVHEEVVGTGFFKEEKEGFYNSLAHSWYMTEAYEKLKEDARQLGKKYSSDIHKTKI